MLRLLRNKKAQNTAEYALLFAIVIGAFTAMQIYVKRGLQARIKDGTNRIPWIVESQAGATNGTDSLFPAGQNYNEQYEPYYIRGGSVDMTSTTGEGTEAATIRQNVAGDTSGIKEVSGASSQRTGEQVMTGVRNE